MVQVRSSLTYAGFQFPALNIGEDNGKHPTFPDTPVVALPCAGSALADVDLSGPGTEGSGLKIYARAKNRRQQQTRVRD